MRTAVTELLEIEFPILAFSHCRDVVAAVTNTGGFGVLGATLHSPERLDVDLRWIDEQVKGKAYGVDLLIPRRYTGSDEDGLDPERVEARIPEGHRAWLEQLLERYGVPPLPDAQEGRREREIRALRMVTPHLSSLVEVAFAHDVRLVASALGPPPPELIEDAHRRGAVVAALAGNSIHATHHVAAGVDLIVAQGYEAGGHTGEIGTMVLVPEIVDRVAPTPVLAAGGIGHGRQIAAALALGAQGVWCGSVWLTTEEAETHPAVKNKLLAASSRDTLRSRSLTGKPARQLRSAWTDEWERADAPQPLPMPLQGQLVAEAQSRIRRGAHIEDSGAHQLANYFVGQIVGTMNEVKSARRVVLDMVEELIDAWQAMSASMNAE
jgi:NAD(P)H-dependent flavin oxidoreductase YrpB (nitropropane dioxygenase family)